MTSRDWLTLLVMVGLFVVFGWVSSPKPLPPGRYVDLGQNAQVSWVDGIYYFQTPNVDARDFWAPGVDAQVFWDQTAQSSSRTTWAIDGKTVTAQKWIDSLEDGREGLLDLTVGGSGEILTIDRRLTTKGAARPRRLK